MMDAQEFKKMVRWCRRNGVDSFSLNGASATIHTEREPEPLPEQEASISPNMRLKQIVEDQMDAEEATMSAEQLQSERRKQAFYWSSTQ